MSRKKNLDVMLQLPTQEDQEEYDADLIAVSDDKSEEDTALVHAFLCGDDEVLLA